MSGFQTVTIYAIDYEDVTTYSPDAFDEEKLLSEQKECVFTWTTHAGKPLGVTLRYAKRNGKVSAVKSTNFDNSKSGSSSITDRFKDMLSGTVRSKP